MTEWIEQLLKAGFDARQISENEPMSRHTTMRVGGAADVLLEPSSEAQLICALDMARALDIPALVIGGGSNLIVQDGGVRGVIIKLCERFARITCEGNVISAEAGTKLAAIANAAQRAGLSGLEFAAGIPGTVGGGVLMNAGAYGGEMSQVLLSGRVLVDGGVQTYSHADFQFGYRHTCLMKNGGIVLGATFGLTPNDPAAIAARMNELAARRRDKQPLNFPSAGSTFKRPEGHYAGALIEHAGLKGASVGGAMVSQKHAGFVVNTGNASARDVVRLIGHIQDTVYAQAGVRLHPEVRVIGEE